MESGCGEGCSVCVGGGVGGSLICRLTMALC